MSVTAGTEIRQVQIINAALSTERIRGEMHRVIRGVLVPEYFDAIQVPSYQRVAMENDKHEDLKEALRPDGGGIPDDLLLCVRIQQGQLQNVGASTFVLGTAGLWLLDGHQRWLGWLHASDDPVACSQQFYLEAGEGLYFANWGANGPNSCQLAGS